MIGSRVREWAPRDAIEERHRDRPRLVARAVGNR